MLNGLYPILIFQFYTKVGIDIANATGIPLPKLDDKGEPLTPIPFYLDERLTGVLITSESKAIDVQTENESSQNGSSQNESSQDVSSQDGAEVKTFQKTLSNRVTIEMVASKSSLVVTAILAFFEQIYRKVTSQEYAISYLSGGITVFNGYLQEFAVDQSNNDDLYHIRLTLEKGNQKTQNSKKTSDVPRAQNTRTLSGGPIGNIPDVQP